MTPSCNTQVTTPTGKFTFQFQEMSYCEAKKVCAEKNEILAPITNRNDYDVINKAVKSGNFPGCPFHNGWQEYFLGLDVTPCGKGKQDRVFTNGEVWNEAVHGKLYVDTVDSWNQPCVFSSYSVDFRKPTIGAWSRCYQSDFRFICLKPVVPVETKVSSESCNSQSEALKSSGNNHSFFALGMVACLASVAVVFAFIAVKYFKKYRAVEEKHAEVEKILR